MVFCRGCGHQIHDTAQYCPQCGATQGRVTSTDKERIHWSSTASFVTAIIVFLLVLLEPDGQWDTDTIVGTIIFGAVPIGLGVYSFSQPSKNGRWMGITGVSLGVIILLVALGSK